MIKKTLTFILALTFLYPITPPAQSEIPETMPLSGLAIPESLGKIQDRFRGTSKHWVIQIQDVHGHVPAQENISAILDHLQAIYGIKTVAVEGGWLASSLPKSWGLPNSREKQMLARALLEDGYLTGPGYAALFSTMPLMLVGVEDEKLYLENREIYLKYLSEFKSTDQKIAQISKTLQEEKNGTYHPELLTFDNRVMDFREGNKAESFLPSIMALAGEHQVDLLKLDQVALFGKILETSQTISQDRLKSESERMTKQYSVKRLSFEELLRSGKIPQEDLEYYPEMQKYIEVMKLQDKMDHILFFDQIEALIQEVKTKLLTTPEEKSLDQKSERWMLMKKLLTFKATPKDFQHFNQDQTEIEALAQENELTKALELSKEFYNLAQKRDEIFFEKLTKDERLSTDVAIVTGGFHTDGLSAQLRTAGISYVVITPDLAGEMPNEKMYHEMLTIHPPVADHQTLSAYRSELRQVFDEALVRGTGAATKGGGVDIESGKLVFLETLLGSQPKRSASVASDAFSSLPDAELSSQLEILFNQNIPVVGKPALPNSQRTFLVASGLDLKNLTEEVDASAIRAWEYTANNPSNTILVVSEEGSAGIPTSVLGMRAKLVVFKSADVSSALQDPKFLTRFKRELSSTMALMGENLDKKTSALILPKDSFSFIIFRLALLSDGLRQMISTPEGFTRVKNLLSSIQAVQEYLTSA